VYSMSYIYVIDAGVLFSVWIQRHTESMFLTTPHVREEVQNRPSKFRADVLEVLDRLQEDSPTKESVKAARNASLETGDNTSLSENDIELIALAHSKSEGGVKVVLVSTDMAILNTARRMGIETIDPSGKFRDDIQWILVCPACDYRTTKPSASLECPVCGTTMHRKVLKKRRKQ
jgi:rRNA maturation endonuclease Nob1